MQGDGKEQAAPWQQSQQLIGGEKASSALKQLVNAPPFVPGKANITAVPTTTTKPSSTNSSTSISSSTGTSASSSSSIAKLTSAALTAAPFIPKSNGRYAVMPTK